jgi:RNA polymerase sigma factor (sigma-70 family)
MVADKNKATKLKSEDDLRGRMTTPLKKQRIKDLKESPGALTFQAFWITFEPFVKKICHDKQLYPQETDDVLALMKQAVMENIGKYDEDKGRFHTWLGFQARNRAIDVLRKRKSDIMPKAGPATVFKEKPGQHSNPDSEVMTDIMDNAASPATMLCMQEEKDIVNEVLTKVAAKVNPVHYQIFDCAVRREWETKKICQALGVTENQVFIAKTRVGELARKMLAKKFKDLDRAISGGKRKPGRAP